ncbi:MAG TPA: cysteine hydrolase family protein [Solirubrobacteraceae bacterium]|nr:cysteine hydrolase family protein [Solirubrobacteraceae bacterium]
MRQLSHAPALVVVDVQQGFDDPVWGPRSNPGCERNVSALLRRWRRADWPVVLVRHDSVKAGSPLRPGQPGNRFKEVVGGKTDLVVVKSVHSAFHGSPPLHDWLLGHGISTIYICGITTDHCCETTARVAADLGYEVHFVLDATYAFDTVGPGGGMVTADQLMRMTACNLDHEFAAVIDTATALQA